MLLPPLTAHLVTLPEILALGENLKRDAVYIQSFTSCTPLAAPASLKRFFENYAWLSPFRMKPRQNCA